MRNDFANAKVVNLHYTNLCNYRCRFCHSHFQKTPLSFDDWKHIIDNIMDGLAVERFNLAGGEPLAGEFIQDLIDYIAAKNVKCSIITNGSLLTGDFIKKNSRKLSMIGISIDGLDHRQNTLLGRVDKKGTDLSREHLENLADAIHKAEIKLKINTVVNAINYQDDFDQIIKSLAPERWKLLRMLHFDNANEAGKSLMVSDEAFNDFVSRHKHLHPIVEDKNDIVNSYIVVTPEGRLINNANEHYSMTESLLTHPFAEEFAKIPFSEIAYWKRY